MKAMKTLNVFDKRKGICKMIRTRVLADKREPLIVPSQSFYLRWPKHYEKMQQRNKNIKRKTAEPLM